MCVFARMTALIINKETNCEHCSPSLSPPTAARANETHAHPCVKVPYAEKPFVYYSPAVNVITVLSPVVYVI